MKTQKRAVQIVLLISLGVFGWSTPILAAGPHGGGGGGGGARGGGSVGGVGHYGGGRGGYGGYSGRGGYGYGGYGRRGGYYGGYGGWGWGGVALGLGLFYGTLPFYYATYWGADGLPYYYADDNYYRWESSANEYETVSPPPDVQRQAELQSSNLMAYPKNGQSEAQQAADKAECHAWAAGQSGFDPTQAAASQAAASQDADPASASKHSDYMRAQAACFEGRGYSVK